MAETVKRYDPERLLDNLACASQDRRFLEDGDLRELVVLNVINPLVAQTAALRGVVEGLTKACEAAIESLESHHGCACHRCERLIKQLLTALAALETKGVGDGKS